VERGRTTTRRHWSLFRQSLALCTALLLLPLNAMRAAGPLAAEKEVDWPAFMGRHDMGFDRLPQAWTGAPHCGNAMLGSMLYQAGDAIRLQVFRADVHDHRDDSLQGDLYPNGLWYESPCIESTLAAANIIQDMLIQSWSDPAENEPATAPIQS